MPRVAYITCDSREWHDIGERMLETADWQPVYWICEPKVRSLLPDYTAMGETGMDEHAQHLMHHQGPPNTLPMMAGEGPFGLIGMGGMFTILKVRDKVEDLKDPGWYVNPRGTVAGPAVTPSPQNRDASGQGDTSTLYACPMHPDVVQHGRGKCPKCGMTLEKKH